MKSKIEFEECLKDSPQFRLDLEDEEQDIEHLEEKLQKVIKMCTLAVDSGKEYVKNQSAFATSLWEVQKHFADEKAAHNALGKIIHCLQEMNKFHTILLDQASRTVLKNITSFVKTDIKQLKEHKNLFLKVSENLDSALNKNAQANRNRPQEVSEAVNLLSATRSCFRHIALDYVNNITMLQAKKKPEILSTLLSFIQACSTYYHQGSDLCEDFDPFFKCLADDISSMRSESNQLEKSMQNRHTCVNSFVEDSLPTTATTTPATEPRTMEGYLFKRTSKGFKTWNRRWFYMCDYKLVYKKRTGEDTPTIMEEDLRICTVRPVVDSDRRYCFEVISPGKSHILQADSEEMLLAWIGALQKGIGAAIQFNTSPMVGLLSRSELPLNTTSNHKKIHWEEFLKIPGNSECCDCKSTEPRWASINLGITLCIACSGVHRSLGVHYSKVRSLTLDAWEPEIVKVMAEMGNKIVNRVYEAKVDLSVERATPDCDRSIRENWIKTKYIERKFVLPLSTLACTLTMENVADEEKLISEEEEDEEEAAAAAINLEKKDLPILPSSRRWSVRKLRRRPRSVDGRSSEKSKGVHQPLRRLSEKTLCLHSEDEQSETESSKDVTTDSSSFGVLVIGEDLSEPLEGAGLSLSSDQESTNGEDDLLDEEDISTLSPNLLLYKAAAAHNLPVICQAFALGADKNFSNELDMNRTALHQAVLSGSVMACEYVLLNGARIDAVDSNGYTALHLATEKGCTAQAYLLLKHKARYDIVDGNGKQAIDIAVDQANADIVTLLRLTRLNEEIGITEQGTVGDETYNDVMKDFSLFALNQPHKLQRPKTVVVQEDDDGND